MKTKEEVLRILQQEKPELVRRYGVKRLALFGSYARDDQGEDSDVDILVEVDPSIGLGFVELAERIEGALSRLSTPTLSGPRLSVRAPHRPRLFQHRRRDRLANYPGGLAGFQITACSNPRGLNKKQLKLPYVIDNQTYILADILQGLLTEHQGRSLDVATA